MSSLSFGTCATTCLPSGLIFSMVSPPSRLSRSLASSPFSRFSFPLVSSCLLVLLVSSLLSFLPFFPSAVSHCRRPLLSPFSLVSLSLYSFADVGFYTSVFFNLLRLSPWLFVATRRRHRTPRTVVLHWSTLVSGEASM